MDNATNKSFTKQLTVSSYETDKNLDLKLYCLLQWFSEIAWENAKQLGIGFEELADNDKIWILSSLNIKVHRLPKWQDKVDVKTWPSGLNNLQYTREFQVFNLKNECLVSASSCWVIFDKNEQKAVTPPEYDYLTKINNEKALDSLFSKLRPRKDLVPLFKETAKYADIDMHQHVNNAEYVRWIENCIGELNLRRINTFKIQYLHEVKLNDEVVIFLEKTDNNFFWEARINGDKLCFRAEVGLY
jgi:acyl-ACP thioesterase